MVKPTDRALNLGKTCVALWAVLLINVVLQFVCGKRIMNAFYDLILALFGYCSIKNKEAYNIEKVRCLVLICAYLWVMNLVGLIIQIVVLTDPTESENIVDWTQKIYVFTAFMDFVIYIGGVYFDKQLYDELRLNYVLAEVNFAGRNNPFYGGGGYGNQQGANPRMEGNLPPSRISLPPQGQSGASSFIAFQGEGPSTSPGLPSKSIILATFLAMVYLYAELTSIIASSVELPHRFLCTTLIHRYVCKSSNSSSGVYGNVSILYNSKLTKFISELD